MHAASTHRTPTLTSLPKDGTVTGQDGAVRGRTGSEKQLIRE